MGIKRRPHTIDWFWKIIAASRSKWDPEAPDHYRKGNQAVQARELEVILGELPVGEVLEFSRHFSRFFWEAYRWDLWHVAYIANGGCSDDGFMDFRYWLISMGRKVFESALAAPMSMIDVLDQPGVEYPGFEDFGYVAGQVYEEKTGRSLPRFEGHVRSEPEGSPCEDEAAMAARFPALWKKFNPPEEGPLDLRDAAGAGDLRRVDELLESGTGPDETEDGRSLPLYRACLRGHWDVVERLLLAGADVNATDGFRQAAIHAASANGNDDLVSLLLDRGASIDARGGVGRTALFRAVENSHKATVALLGSQGADPNIADEDGCTPLIWAAAEGDRDVVALLLELGADIGHTDNEGYTALDCATENGFTEVASLVRFSKE